jgi:hypothetical protein
MGVTDGVDLFYLLPFSDRGFVSAYLPRVFSRKYIQKLAREWGAYPLPTLYIVTTFVRGILVTSLFNAS